MIMKRSLHACKLTAGKFAAVDLPTFLAVRISHYLHRNWQNAIEIKFSNSKHFTNVIDSYWFLFWYLCEQVFKASYTYYTVLVDDNKK